MPMDIVLTVILAITIFVWLTWSRLKGIGIIRRNLVAVGLLVTGMLLIEMSGMVPPGHEPPAGQKAGEQAERPQAGAPNLETAPAPEKLP